MNTEMGSYVVEEIRRTHSKIGQRKQMTVTQIIIHRLEAFQDGIF